MHVLCTILGIIGLLIIAAFWTAHDAWVVLATLVGTVLTSCPKPRLAERPVSFKRISPEWVDYIDYCADKASKNKCIISSIKDNSLLWS